MSFPPTRAILRTDDNFRLRLDPDHHIKYSIIEELIDFDCVLDFPICDTLHLFHIGINKRMFKRWLDGTKTYKKVFIKSKLQKFDYILASANQCKPTEINRAIRTTKEFARWKATEHRTMLTYVGIVILKDFIPADEYEMFLYLSCAFKLASVDRYLNVDDRINLIEILLDKFVKKYTKLYGKHTITSNVHNLLHVSADLRRFGNINSVSTYPFENHLGKIQTKIRAYRNPLQQFANRVGEIEQFDFNSIDINSVPEKQIELKHPDSNGFKTLIVNDYQLSSQKIADSWFMSANKIIKYEKTVRSDNEILIYGREIPDKNSFFEYPFDSAHISIYESNCIEKDQIICRPKEIECKLFRLPYGETYVFQPMLHTIA